MKDYPINIFYSDEDKCYVADIPDLKFCSAFGDTPEEALHELIIAKKLWLEVAKETNRKIPKPSSFPKQNESKRRRTTATNGKPVRSRRQITKQKIRSS